MSRVSNSGRNYWAERRHHRLCACSISDLDDHALPRWKKLVRRRRFQVEHNTCDRRILREQANPNAFHFAAIYRNVSQITAGYGVRKIKDQAVRPGEYEHSRRDWLAR